MNINITDKLRSYFTKIEEETGRKINIEVKNHLGTAGFTASFTQHPTDIQIFVARQLLSNTDQTEQSLAHEVTHGLLLYGMGYSTMSPVENLSRTDLDSLGLIGTMIDDIVVNKIISKEGFKPYGEAYPTMVKREATALNMGEDFYKQFNFDSTFKNRFITLRYILAWGYKEYYSIDKNLKVDIANYHKAVKKQYPDIYNSCIQITMSLKENDIFKSDGHRNIIDDVLDLWGLSDSVELVNYKNT